MGEFCGDGCVGCSSDRVESSTINEVRGYINIYDVGGFLQAQSGIYEEEQKAKEVGESTKGYVATVFISFPFKEKF